jgi:hypothetical protein
VGARDRGEEGGLCTDNAECGDGGVAVCVIGAGTDGICLVPCPAASTYISTGGCSEGFRCVTLDEDAGEAFCFPDCDSGDDCASGACVGENVCDLPAEAPMDGGGATDSGTGTSDASTPTRNTAVRNLTSNTISRNVIARNIIARDITVGGIAPRNLPIGP